MLEHCVLSELNLSVSYLGQEGALLLCQALKRPGCPMEKLGLGQLTKHYSMSVTFSVNVPPIKKKKKNSICHNSLARCELTQPVFKELGSLLSSGTSRLKSLSVGVNQVGDEGVKYLWDAVAHRNCLLEDLE